MDIIALHHELRTLARDRALLAEQHVRQRAEALDFIRFVEEVVTVARPSDDAARVAALAQEAAVLKKKLEETNTQLFMRVRTAIAEGLRGDDLRTELNRYTTYDPRGDRVYFDFDGLDILLDGVWNTPTTPSRTIQPDPEMVHYEDTPARALLDMIDHVPITADDVFYDLGSGLGQIPLLVHLLTGANTRGVEVEPAYHQTAQRIAASLGLTGINLICADARTADYSDGTIFFMFTPFHGEMLRRVLARLHAEGQRRPITICTFGPCTLHVTAEPWLRLRKRAMNHEYRLAIFENR